MCLFCEYDKDKFIMENNTCYAIYDEYPVNRGHILVIPKSHKIDFFDLNYQEYVDMISLIRNCKSKLDTDIQPDGYNVGFNCGEYAGQSIFHCHAHLIPRFKGDVKKENLRGGIRNFKKPLKELDYA